MADLYQARLFAHKGEESTEQSDLLKGQDGLTRAELLAWIYLCWLEAVNLKRENYCVVIIPEGHPELPIGTFYLEPARDRLVFVLRAIPNNVVIPAAAYFAGVRLGRGKMQ